jgi:serine/threonine protein kinase/tetratricopeptide (TPR) repeat protein
MMGSEHRRWDNVKALFQQAIELVPEEREAFLTRACGEDAELRSEVQSLLASHDDERPFLEASPVPGAAHALAAALDDTDERSAGLEPGSRIGQYEVLDCLGTGGMGEVYRARDTRLDRFVALKIVHESATGRSADRVLREARAASALNHPNICTIYEVGEFEGRPFLAMEYIAGQTLSGLIPPDGLPAEDIVTYGVQIADALAHAHEHGVTHRDLKGTNVVVTPEGRAKVLDFGLAKRVAGGGVSPLSGTLTLAGTIAGTPAFMAPELLRDQQADARSDIWALGVVLYEMASGRRPFPGDTPFEVTSAILRDTPPPLPPGVPAALQSVIFRCLARDPDDRFQRASDLVAALQTRHPATPIAAFRTIGISRQALLGFGAAALLSVLAYLAYLAYQPPEATSVAVLRFNVLSGAPEFGFLGIGVPDTIMSRLALVNGVRVRAVLAKASGDPQDEGKGLGVEYVLTGTIQKPGDQIRITPQLVRVEDGVTVWTRAYTLSSTNLLALQDEIARGVVDALPVRMTSEDRARVYRRYTNNPEAYALYVRGRAELVRRDSTVAAVESFQAAIALDQDYVLAHAGLAMASAKMRLFIATEAEVATWQTRAHLAAQRALQLNPDLAETREALAAVFRSTEFDWPATLEESARALRLNPNLDQPHVYRASAFSHLGLLDRAESEARAAQDSNPANASEPLRVQGVTAMFGGRFDVAVTLLKEAGGSAAEWNLAYAYYYAGRQADAEAMLRTMTGSARSQRRAQATLASFLAARKRASEARELIRVVTGAPYQEHHVAYAVGAAYAQLDMPAEALEWLKVARTTGFECYPWFERDPLLARLKQSGAFRQFLDEFKQSWQTTKAGYETER